MPSPQSIPSIFQVYRRPSGELAPTSRLELITLPIPSLTGNDVLIKIHAVSLNYRDINILRGGNPWNIKPQGIPCSDGVGEVIATGSNVKQFGIGDRVGPVLDLGNLTGREDGRSWLGGDADGLLGTHVIFKEEELLKLPEHLGWNEASTVLCAGLTAWNALSLPNFLTSKTLLLQGTGGVSIFTLKLAYASNARIIITSSSDFKLAALKQRYPGIETLNYASSPDWDAKVLEMTDGRGVDIVIENGGAATVTKSGNINPRCTSLSFPYMSTEHHPSYTIQTHKAKR